MDSTLVCVCSLFLWVTWVKTMGCDVNKSHGRNARFWLVETKFAALWLVTPQRGHHDYFHKFSNGPSLKSIDNDLGWSSVNHGALLDWGARVARWWEHSPPAVWPGLESQRRRHVWVEVDVGSLLCSERFFSGYSDFPLSSKTSFSIFHFDQQSGRRGTN